jgi:hypothetical protein
MSSCLNDPQSVRLTNLNQLPQDRQALPTIIKEIFSSTKEFPEWIIEVPLAQ